MRAHRCLIWYEVNVRKPKFHLPAATLSVIEHVVQAHLTQPAASAQELRVHCADRAALHAGMVAAGRVWQWIHAAASTAGRWERGTTSVGVYHPLQLPVQYNGGTDRQLDHVAGVYRQRSGSQSRQQGCKTHVHHRVCVVYVRKSPIKIFLDLNSLPNHRNLQS